MKAIAVSLGALMAFAILGSAQAACVPPSGYTCVYPDPDDLSVFEFKEKAATRIYDNDTGQQIGSKEPSEPAPRQPD
jgi:hypothetical protein